MPQSVSIHSAMLCGLDVTPLEVECTISPGMPHILIIGVAGADAHEGVSRVRSALLAAGYEAPQASVTVQVHPSSGRARGTQLDLAIAFAILHASRQVPAPQEGSLFVGELALDDRVMSTRGLACYSDWCADHGMTLVCPTSSEHISHVPVDTLADLRTLDWYHRVSSRLTPAPTQPQELPDVLRTAFCACLGTNRILLLRGEDGPVSRSAIVLHRSIPQLTQDQCDELVRIHSTCMQPFTGENPFRAPHHSITMAGMVGGGRPVMPGEVSLATHGVLLLSDIERFADSVLSTLRVALADHQARIVRAEGAWTMPAAPALTIVTSRDTKTPAKQLLRALAALEVEEVFV